MDNDRFVGNGGRGVHIQIEQNGEFRQFHSWAFPGQIGHSPIKGRIAKGVNKPYAVPCFATEPQKCFILVEIWGP